MEKIADQPTMLLEYDVIQDRRGWWIVGYYARTTGELVFLRSRDLQTWELLARVPTQEQMGFSLMQDRSERYGLAAYGADGSLCVWMSSDGKSWSKQVWPYYHSVTPQVTRTHLLSYSEGRWALLASDKITGLQYAVWSPGEPLPKLDLVSRANIQNFTAAEMPNGRSWLALEDSETVDLREYEAFNVTGKDATNSNADWPIYVETEKDGQGHTWRRFTARERCRVPDVTSLAIEPNGRVWWGIESGIMTFYGNEFAATDVSQGFVTNDIHRLYAVPNRPGMVDLEAANGQFWQGNPWKGWQQIPRPAAAVSGNGRQVRDTTGGLWSFPDDDSPSKGLDYFDGHTHHLYNPPHDVFDAPSSIALDKDGNIWAGTWFKGLYELLRKP